MGFKLKKWNIFHFPFTECKTRLLNDDNDNNDRNGNGNGDGDDDVDDDEKLLRRYIVNIVKWKEEIPSLVVFFLLCIHFISFGYVVIFFFSFFISFVAFHRSRATTQIEGALRTLLGDLTWYGNNLAHTFAI